MTSIYDARKILGVWVVKARTPSGKPLLVNHKGTMLDALCKAVLAAQMEETRYVPL